MTSLTFVLLGHRGTGKTTIGRALQDTHQLEVIDLDDLIERQELCSCAELVASDERRFRQLERDAIAHLIASPSDKARVIVPGAGCQATPLGAIYIWLWRDGWERSARTERARLRPELSFEEEVSWMRETREPRWARAAHALSRISRGTREEDAAARVANLISWFQDTHDNAITRRSWLVPAAPDHLERAVSDARLLGAAGVELRSDFFEAPPTHLDVPFLASLRSNTPAWLGACHACAAIDIDESNLDAVLEASTLSALTPRPLMLSSHPPAGTDHHDALATLERAYRELIAAAPEWAEHISLKFAPTLEDAASVLDTLNHCATLDVPVTFLPQGADFAWTRPWLASNLNQSNYIAVGLSARRTGQGTSAQPTPYDLQDWLPHITGAAPETFDALLGDPVQQSIGDVWHRRASQRESTPTHSYVKIRHPKTNDGVSLANMFALAKRLGVRGFSVTSPLKQHILNHPSVTSELSAANTLRPTSPSTWQATDTDEAGMTATLAALEARGVGPGTIAIIGRGGVSPAVTRAVDARAGWELILHASAREGWPVDATPVDVIINASGDRGSAYERPPEHRAWVDLHYSGVREPPSDALHLNGDIFFSAQAQAQREFWANKGQG